MQYTLRTVVQRDDGYKIEWKGLLECTVLPGTWNGQGKPPGT